MCWHAEEDQPKVRTVSRKSERLVNLTIALLATGRWLSKSEIFQSIDGYSGDTQSQERMFERDKEELRNLGIEIEVGTFDPLFEDEVGYRIRPEKYRINLSQLTTTQLSLLSVAAASWKRAEINSQASSALLKLSALGIESDLDGINPFTPVILSSHENLGNIMDAIASKKVVSFQYRLKDFSSQERVIEPYGVGTKHGYWYVAGLDLDRKAVRLFRLDRCISEIREQGKANSYEIPPDFSMRQQLASRDRNNLCLLEVRTDRGSQIRRHARPVQLGDEWDTVEYPFSDTAELVRDLLWHRDDVRIIDPGDYVGEYRLALERIAEIHG